jgi:hypothetical protein
MEVQVRLKVMRLILWLKKLENYLVAVWPRKLFLFWVGSDINLDLFLNLGASSATAAPSQS